MSSRFNTTAAILALVTGLGGMALAQTATDSTAAQPDAAAPIAADALPEILTSLDLRDVVLDQDRRHTEVEGTLPDGTRIEAKLDPSGALRMIEAGDDAPLPASVIDALVPQPVRDSDIFAQFATIDELALPPAPSPMAGVMVKGANADGEAVRAAFAEDGTLIRFGLGEDDHGPRGGHGGKGRDHGSRGGHGPDGHEAGMGDHGRMGGDRHGSDRMQGQPFGGLDEATVTTILTDAGYTDLGAITQDGPRRLIAAVNAAGEPVTVELNPRGEVIRETAR